MTLTCEMMRICLLATLLACFGIAGAYAAGSKQNEPGVIVNRKDDTVTVFFQLSMADLIDRIGPAPFVIRQRGAALAELQAEAAALRGWLEGSLTARSGLTEMTAPLFAATLHTVETAPPFGTPREASTATAVCTAPPGTVPEPDQMIVVAGFILPEVDGFGPLDLRFGDGAATYDTAQFWDWSAGARTMVAPDAAGWLALGRRPGADWPLPLFLGGAAIAAGSGLVLTLRRPGAATVSDPG